MWVWLIFFFTHKIYHFHWIRTPTHYDVLFFSLHVPLHPNFSISFEFVKAVGDSVKQLALPSGQEASGRVLKHIVGQGPIYVRALRKISLPEFKVEEL